MINQQAVSRRLRILIVDDHPLVREGLRARISSQNDMEICGESESVDQALAEIRSKHPDLVIVDIQLVDSHGIDLVKAIHDRYPSMRILVVSAYDEALYGERALRAGAHGYINKRELHVNLLEAIRALSEGERYLSPDMTQKMLNIVTGSDRDVHSDPIHKLSKRELEVFELIGRGKTTSAIANQLMLSTHTIDTYREKLRHKLSVKNSNELMQRAMHWVIENG